MTNTKMIVNTREYRAKQNDEDLENLLKEQNPTTPPVDEENKTGFNDNPSAEGNWEKRYSDLRSHSQKQLNEANKRIEALEKKINQKPNTPPSTPEEFEAWVQQFPDAVRMFKTLIHNEQNEAVTPAVTGLQEKIESLEYELRKERAFARLQSKHNDATEILQNADFHGWLEDQRSTRGRVGQALYDAIYSDDLDADAAADVIATYKQSKGLNKKKETTRDTREAALSVTSQRTPNPSVPEGKRTYTEEEIEAMSIREYEKLEADIDLARQEGRVLTRRIGAAL